MSAVLQVAVRRDRRDDAPYRWAVLCKSQLPGTQAPRAPGDQHEGWYAMPRESLSEALEAAYALMGAGLAKLDDREVPYCPDCGWDHDPVPCMDDGALCDCCTALLGVQATAERAS